MKSIECDVAIIGGGPGGSTVGSLLRKYNPKLKIHIFEREKFPRDHVGESLLPVISGILNEMGAWDKIEGANFPVKIGATYRWGRTSDLWDFEFLPDGKFDEQRRPAPYEGQRKETAFQVDRSVYDDILLNHAQSMGCEVHQETAVRTVERDGDRVTGLILADGTEVKARYYIDASGHAGLLRRAMGVHVDCPTTLQNIAIWEYWRNAEWAVTLGVGGTRIQVLSLPYGWLWFIPVGPDRTSLGLVVPASYYKQSGKKPAELYKEAIMSDPIVSQLLQKATPEGKVLTTNDWSFVSERLTGENWFLVGECAGFADPILSAGLSLAHIGARDVAYAILALDRKDYEPEWLKGYYDTTHRYQIRQHMRFADFWYSLNGVFSDLKDEAQRIALAAGLEMTSDRAWQWLGQGGFIERHGGTSVGGYGLLLAKQIISSFTGDKTYYEIVGKTHFKLNLEDAEKDWMADMNEGRITRRRMYRRNGKILPIVGTMAWLASILKTELSYDELDREIQTYLRQKSAPGADINKGGPEIVACLEALVSEGWILARTEQGFRSAPPILTNITGVFHENRDVSRLQPE